MPQIISIFLAFGSESFGYVNSLPHPTRLEALEFFFLGGWGGGGGNNAFVPISNMAIEH